MAKTSEIATNFHGNQPYQQRARSVLPLLVRQAKAHQPIYYDNLAEEVGMPNPRNLNFPLGCIGDALNEVADEWDAEVPHIQSIVINRATDLPGPGFDGFLRGRGKDWESTKERRAIIEAYWAEVYKYPYWKDVLKMLKLKPATSPLTGMITSAGRGRGGGEGQEHLRLKEMIVRSPHLVGVKTQIFDGQMEHCLPSGDQIDVYIKCNKALYAVEIKPSSAPLSDVTRGLFQCVKYRAVLDARAAYESDQRSINVCLGLGGEFPSELIPLRNSLKVEVVEHLSKHL